MKAFLLVLLFPFFAQAKICNVVQKVGGVKIGQYRADTCGPVTKFGGPWGDAKIVDHIEDTVASKADDDMMASFKTAEDDKVTKLTQAKALRSSLQSSSDPKDKFLLYLLNQELAKIGQ